MALGPGQPGFDQLAQPLKDEAWSLVQASGGRVTIVSGYRSHAEQAQLYAQNCPGGRCTTETAKPGSSQHELGRAVDLGGDLGLAASLAPRFHLARTVPSEAWHYEDAANRSGGGGGGISLPNPIDAVTGAVGSVKDALAKLIDPHTWWRVTMIVGGLALVVVAVVVMDLDLGAAGRTLTQGAAGVGEVVGSAAGVAAV